MEISSFCLFSLFGLVKCLFLNFLGLVLSYGRLNCKAVGKMIFKLSFEYLSNLFFVKFIRFDERLIGEIFQRLLCQGDESYEYSALRLG